MEVDKVSFYPLLLDILTDISEAHFVAFDLELSGVPSKGAAKGGKDGGRQSLQQRYMETKEAAERYQILQIGLTCVTQDVEHKKYLFKPYNFEISPLIDERGIDIERIFSFQSGAAEFLLKTGFNLSTPFERGVPYLSREESREARGKHAKRQDKTAIADIQLKPTEVDSLAFLERVRSDIKAWMASKSLDTMEYLNISAAAADEPRGEDSDNEAPPELSRFEKRLVHQLVRAEFPELVTVSKRGFIQIVRFDHEREQRIAAGRRRELEESLSRQKGFRWIIEAMLGNDISGIDLRECAKNPVTGEAIFVDMHELKAQFGRAQTFLRNNPRVVVGHNCFLDLVYIYRTFVGALPDTVEEFQQALHKIWPLVVDTKYMSTHNCSDINPVSSLEQVASQLSAQRTPILEVDQEHIKYAAAEALHEAGYDSFLTAQIAVRLSAKLEGDGAYVDFSSIANDIDGMKLTNDAADTNVARTAEPDIGEGFTPSVAGAKWKRRGDPTLPPPNADDPFSYNPGDLKHRFRDANAGKKGFEGGMPGFGSDFWRVYGNKLRVFGTQEAVCPLDNSSEADTDGSGGREDGGVVLPEQQGKPKKLSVRWVDGEVTTGTSR